MAKSFDTPVDDFSKTKAFLVTLQTAALSTYEAQANLDELKGLCRTMGLICLDGLIVHHRESQPRLLIGTGKAQEIKQKALELEADIIVFDDDLSPSQQRNWEELTELTVIDRQEVILEIFSQRAQTREAVLQVGLARMEYSLPRLTRSYTDLSRQRGGAKNNRGGGEMKLEVDKRIILKKIDQFKDELKQVTAHRQRTRQLRSRTFLPSASIVGYTNAGKSTLMNQLSSAGVLQEDKLFATLDPTTRRVHLNGGIEILLTDTVGFIQKLPHKLIEAFKSTLEETLEADFLIHVIDVSHPQAELQMNVTERVLTELGASNKNQLYVFNKTDQLKNNPVAMHSWEIRYPEAVFVSLHEPGSSEKIKKALEEKILNKTPPKTFHLPLTRPDLCAYLHKNAQVLFEEYRDEYVDLQALVIPEFMPPVQQYAVIQ